MRYYVKTRDPDTFADVASILRENGIDILRTSNKHMRFVVQDPIDDVRDSLERMGAEITEIPEDPDDVMDA